MDRLEHALDTTAPPPLREAATRAGCPAAGIRELVAARRIVVIDDDLAYATPAYRELERKALALAGTSPLTPAALRDATGTSRKYVMAILEDLGRRGVLKRTPDGHVPGPRAAIERELVTDADITATPHVSGIVLAGGASKRFGSDKLEATLEGRTLLGRAIDAVAAVSTEVIVVVAPGDDRLLPDAGSVPVRRAEDPETHGGPLVGLLAGLERAREPLAIVAGGDMPTMSVDVLSALVRALAATEGASDAAVLVRQGMERPLPAVLRNGAATQAARRLLAEDERSLRALLAILRDAATRGSRVARPRPLRRHPRRHRPSGRPALDLSRREQGKTKAPACGRARPWEGGNGRSWWRSAPVGVVGELRESRGTLEEEEGPNVAQGNRETTAALAAGAPALLREALRCGFGLQLVDLGLGEDHCGANIGWSLLSDPVDRDHNRIMTHRVLSTH